MDTQSILKMIGALGGAVGGVAGSFGGAASPTSLAPASGPTLDQLTLNPQIMGGESPRIPYDFGQGQNTIPPPTQPPMAPQGAEAPAEGGAKKEKTWQEHVGDLGKAITSAANASKSVNNSPLAQRMFQETQQAQIAQNQIQKSQMDKFRRQDLSSQILEKYGLL